MPLIRCPKCDRAYDVPGVVAVRLPASIAPCACGEWLSGSKAAVLARTVDASRIREVDLAPYLVESRAPETQAAEAVSAAPPARPRSVRVIAHSATGTINEVFTIHEHPLRIGRAGSHIELPDAELSIHHCSISVSEEDLVLRDEHSHTGTFLDGREVDEAIIGDGVHLIRAGSALISIEPTDEEGTAVEALSLNATPLSDEALLAQKLRSARTTQAAIAARIVLICVEGMLAGQEFEVPATGLVVGREGHVRVPDEFLSRRHFEVIRDDAGAVRVRDLGSRNGTFLNTLPARNTRVQVGDEIRAGVNRFRVEQRA